MPPSIVENPLRTRADVQRLVGQLVAPVLPHFSTGRAQVRLGATHAWYGEPADLLEGFSRPQWGLVPLGAGGGAFGHWQLWRDGLAAGTDPEHAEFWGWAGDFDQRIVEMAALALGLILLPDELWHPLSSAVQERVVAWLQRVNTVRPVDSNWLFFRVLVNLALRRCGSDYAKEKLKADLDRLDEFHLGDGWYSDGPPNASLRDGRVGDYYVPMGMHFYGLVYAGLEREHDADRATNFAERARVFAQDFVYWFSADGDALPFGRSLTYRFAQGAFWGALAFAGVETLPWPVIKGLYLRHLRWWMQQPIFSETGLLTIGYTYPNLFMAESYNGPGSPYWALKVFLPLALREDHPFWRAPEAPLPERKAVHTVANARLVLVTADQGREVIAVNAGQAVEDWPRHASHKYCKFAYSTRFGFCVPVGAPTAAEGGFDSALALTDDGRRYRARDRCLEPEVRDGVAYSRWQAWSDVEVRTWLVAAESCHVRMHWVRSARPLHSLEGGFATGYDQRDTIRRRGDSDRIEVTTPHGSSSLRDLSGSRELDATDLGANSSLLHSLAIMPVLRGTHEPGEFWLACMAWGGPPSDGAVPGPPGGSYAMQFSGEGCTLLRDGAPWWSTRGPGCGVSAPARLLFLETRTLD
jgi:hypothetical protein